MIASNRSIGSHDDGPNSCAPTLISSDDNPRAKTLIKYEIDESLDIKEEIVQDEDLHQKGKHDLQSGKNQSNKKCITTEISSHNNSGAKTLIEYDIDESLDIKEEIVEDPERQQQVESSLLLGNNQRDEKYITTEIPCDNKSRAKTLIKYEYEDTLEIMEEIILDQENIEQGPNKKYDSEFCTLNRRVVSNTTDKKPQICKKKNTKKSKSEPKKKYKCEKCARSYNRKDTLNRHKKFECDVMPQFRCKLCGRLFKRKCNMNAHVIDVHQKADPKVPQTRHICDKCAKSYSSLKILNEHKRTEHTVVKPQFICDVCSFQTKRKKYLSKHITTRHFQKIHAPIAKPEKKYKCEKCARSYTQKDILKRHTKFECGVMPQFICEICGKAFKLKCTMNRHILRLHQKTKSNASQTKHNCAKTSRSYVSRDKRQFICDLCGFKTKRKYYLSNHITSKHPNL